jgi:aspartyl-tRNA(Asn)/glutamyl-tRNA(Gln) amidotransferase subunit B
MPPLPNELFEKFTKQYKLSSYDALVIIEQKEIAIYFESIVKHTKNFKSAANWVMGNIKSHLNQQAINIDSFEVSSEKIAQLINLIDNNEINHSVASQKVFPEMIKTPQLDPKKIAEKNNWINQQNEDGITSIILDIFKSNPSETERFKNGERKLTGFFMGQIMKATKGTADPKTTGKLLQQLINKI